MIEIIRLVNYHPVSEEMEYFSKRYLAYKTIFVDVSQDILLNSDSYSTIYQVKFNGRVVGGFRLTLLGDKRSEAERIFVDFPFVHPSFEFGRFWLDQSVQGVGFGRQVGEVVFNFFRENHISVYLKTNPALGSIAVEGFGARDENVSRLNPTLGYICHLYSFGVK